MSRAPVAEGLHGMCSAYLHPEAWLAEARLVTAQGMPHVDHLFGPT